jgi:UDP-glucose:glycoprotein glucosyltransferase
MLMVLIPCSTGSSEKLSAEDDRSPIEFDPIVPLLKAYLGNNSVPDPASPLTELELLGKGHELYLLSDFLLLFASDIGYQATQLIIDSPEPLQTLIHLSQNFPKYATSIARRVNVNERLTAEVHKNHLLAQPGVNMMWLNGAQIPEKDVNPFKYFYAYYGYRYSLTS